MEQRYPSSDRTSAALQLHRAAHPHLAAGRLRRLGGAVQRLAGALAPPHHGLQQRLRRAQPLQLDAQRRPVRHQRLHDDCFWGLRV